LKLLEKGQIIISTPEKWDALSRSWKQRKGVYGLSLFIVDDLHLIGGHDGSILEVIVSRMRYIQCINAVNQMRIVALSTSVDDGEDIGGWIGAPKHALFNFLPHVRQMPVDIVLQEMDLPNVEIRITGINMAKLTCTTIFHHARNGKPCLVFVPTDQEVQPAVLNLVTFLSADSNSKQSLSLLPYIGKVTNRILRHTLLHGVGYLHEGFDLSVIYVSNILLIT
jgi:pre-mRNA-splicing helicase BRR2